MSYREDTIATLISDIDHNKIYLPALQRRFVWGKRQIELLFDSLMRNYPFGTFLFWRLNRSKAESYVFYEFLKEYDERNPYNRRKTGAFTHEEIIGVLDGQQRLSSMYVGLMGTHTEKAPYKRRANPNAYEKTYLYLNLLSLPYRINARGDIETLEDRNFEFRFLTEASAAANIIRKTVGEDDQGRAGEAMFWMKAGQVLSWGNDPEVDQIIDDFSRQCHSESQRKGIQGRKRYIRYGLGCLHSRVRKDKLINYFEVAKDELEDILKIFVRVNSGGTVLSKTDLLFSTIVATWDNGREQIEDLLKKINVRGDGFTFGNEYLMRCCLVLSDGPVVYKVNSFRSKNVQRIRDEWRKIADAVAKTVDLLVEFGFNGNTLTSQNATIIIAYYIFQGGDLSNESKNGIRKYLIHALLNGAYSSSQDQLITALRNAFREEVQTESGGKVYQGTRRSFRFEDLLDAKLPPSKTLKVTKLDIERFLESTKGPSSFLVLSLLYPQLRFNEVVFHQDHIHPASGFADDKFREMDLQEDQWEQWRIWRDSVPNLQLMEGRQNESKNATPLKLWIEQMNDDERSAFIRSNFIPEDTGLGFEDFPKFFARRKTTLRERLKSVLSWTDGAAAEDEVEWTSSDEEVEPRASRPAVEPTE